MFHKKQDNSTRERRWMGRGKEQRDSERRRMLIVCSPTCLYTVFCFLPLSSLILPHPPLFSSILMPGLGGLTCLVIDGNVSGSHFPRQHPAAFHQAWCRGEPITWMLLTLCLLCLDFSDPLLSLRIIPSP